MDSAYQLNPRATASCQVVAGIGQQRETRPEPPGQCLEGHERKREYERGAQRPLGHPRGNVRMAVGAVVRVVVGHCQQCTRWRAARATTEDTKDTKVKT